MIGQLPKTIKVGEKEEPIRTDFRDILTIFTAFNDEELSLEEKMLVCLRIIYINMDDINPDLYYEAYEKAVAFININQSHYDCKDDFRLMDWEQDEQLIFAAVNKVAGTEVRLFDYMHWWTFMGYYMGIGESLFADVVNIRAKKHKHKKLDAHEIEFYKSNKEMVDLRTRYTKEELKEREELKKILGIG